MQKGASYNIVVELEYYTCERRNKADAGQHENREQRERKGEERES